MMNEPSSVGFASGLLGSKPTQGTSELKGAMEREWSLVKGKVENDRTQNNWDSAIRSLEDVAIHHPDIRRSREYERELAITKGLQEEADSMVKRERSEALKLLTQGQGVQALSKAQDMRKYYPERNFLGKVILGGGVAILFFSVFFYLVWSSIRSRKTPRNGAS